MTDEETSVNRAPNLSTNQPNTSQLFDYGVHIASRTLFLFEEISRPTAAKLLMGLQVLEGGGPVTVKISTRGGCRASGLSIYDGMRACSDVRAVGYGEVCSMGAVILQAAAARELMPNAVVMVHPGYSSVAFDHDENTQRTAEYAKRMRDRCCEILAEKMGVTLKQFLRRFTWDTYLTAREAVEMGLADRVLEPHASLSLVAAPARTALRA
ncbi:MAG TPA: ATP-dependent Clp protease proteolytic subunit [Pyrinomonadaceae bacterium]